MATLGMTRATRLRAGLLGLLASLAALGAHPAGVAAATITVIDYDSAGEGFKDPTPVVPVGGNSGTTRGAQRLNAFQFAADTWGAQVDSAVEIRVAANFNPLSCTSTYAVLGSAGPVTAARDFSGAPAPQTWYPIALANALTGADMDPGADDISATFNSTIGTTCAFPLTWYYGLDGQTPPGTIDFVTVVMHELGHGLGFLTFVNLSTGAKMLGYDDAFMRHLEHHATGKLFTDMTDLERIAASTSGAGLHWIGPHVRADSGVLTAGRVGDHVQMFAPNPQQGGSSVSHFDTALSPSELMEPSYTGPLHTPGLATSAFQDLGWSLASGAAELSVDPPQADFGGVPVGTASPLIIVTVDNIGAEAVTLGTVQLAGPGASRFNVKATKDTCSGQTLAPAGSCTIGVRFRPTDAVPVVAELLIPTNPAGEWQFSTVLVGRGLGPEISATPVALDFGSAIVGGVRVSRTLTLQNIGTENLTVSTIALGGLTPGQFKKPAAYDYCSGTVLTPGASCTVKVKFKATVPGPASATLIVPSNDWNENPVTVPLSGVAW